MIESIIEKLKLLKLKTCADNIIPVIEGAKEKNWSALQIIEHLLDLELEIREKNRIALRFKQSRLLEKPTIDQFDFDFHISRKKQKNRILNLMDLEFIKQKKDVILIGNPGVGKSFLAKCIAYLATQSSVKVLFTTAMDMINHLIAAEADHSLLKKLHYYQYERCSSVITTNLPFAQWGNIFDSTTVATAIADRLVYNSEILIMEGSSYRKRTKRE
jgi:DNA replication protein DnaC